MSHSGRAAVAARSAPTESTRDQSAPKDAGLTTEQALAEIARLAYTLCDHLADDQWRTVDQIRHLAETAHPSTGAS
ncbi:hypothetical protein ABCR94_38445 [Streptomyces sp. 21So2-11]|uniref:hypothetical protein n=1 Tax=Streptomyces sp. 21So2-11 TaxID=3144408 RepID=UPI00321A6506